MTFNVDLMRKVVNAVEEGARTKQWNQSSFIGKNECGTTYCTAGFAMILSGYTIKNNCFYNHQEIEVSPDDAARQLLGITYLEAEEMFFNTETTDPNDVRMWAKEVAANHGVDL